MTFKIYEKLTETRINKNTDENKQKIINKVNIILFYLCGCEIEDFILLLKSL